MPELTELRKTLLGGTQPELGYLCWVSYEGPFTMMFKKGKHFDEISLKAFLAGGYGKNFKKRTEPIYIVPHSFVGHNAVWGFGVVPSDTPGAMRLEAIGEEMEAA